MFNRHNISPRPHTIAVIHRNCVNSYAVRASSDGSSSIYNVHRYIISACSRIRVPYSIHRSTFGKCIRIPSQGSHDVGYDAKGCER